MTTLLEFLQHCHTIALPIVHKPAVPVFQCRKKCVSTVLIVTVVGAEGHVVGQLLEILVVEALQPLAVEFVPFL